MKSAPVLYLPSGVAFERRVGLILQWVAIFTLDVMFSTQFDSELKVQRSTLSVLYNYQFSAPPKWAITASNIHLRFWRISTVVDYPPLSSKLRSGSSGG